MTAKDREPPRRRLRRFLIRAAVVCIGPPLLYFVTVLVLGWIPVNTDYSESKQGIAVHIWSNGMHTDFLLPVHSTNRDWTRFAPLENQTGRDPALGFVLIGWGDRSFYIDTPTEAEFALGNALSAIFLPTASVLHVKYFSTPPRTGERCVKLILNEQELQRLATFIEQSFTRDENDRPVLISGKSYGSRDAFYEANGSYHLFNTCNNWANRALAVTGARSPVWAPFEGPIFSQLASR